MTRSSAGSPIIGLPKSPSVGQLIHPPASLKEHAGPAQPGVGICVRVGAGCRLTQDMYLISSARRPDMKLPKGPEVAQLICPPAGLEVDARAAQLLGQVLLQQLQVQGAPTDPMQNVLGDALLVHLNLHCPRGIQPAEMNERMNE